MTVVSINELKGDPKDLLAKYDSASAKVFELPRAPGMISHTCVELPDGLRVVNIYQTEEQARAANERPEFREILRTAGLPEPSPTIYRVHKYRIMEGT